MYHRLGIANNDEEDACSLLLHTNGSALTSSVHYVRRKPKNQIGQENEKWLNLFIIILHGLETISNCLVVLRDVNNRMSGAPPCCITPNAIVCSCERTATFNGGGGDDDDANDNLTDENGSKRWQLALCGPMYDSLLTRTVKLCAVFHRRTHNTQVVNEFLIE